MTHPSRGSARRTPRDRREPAPPPRRRSGPPRDDVADVDLTSLLEVFLAESHENLCTMEQTLVSLEERPDDVELLHTIFRTAHTLKGNAASMGLGGVAELAHAVEGLLDRLRQRSAKATPPIITVLLESVDAVRKMLPAREDARPQPVPAPAGLIARLRRPPAAREAARAPEAARSSAPSTRGGAAPGPEDDSDTLGRILRVGIHKLDRLLNLTGELTIARGRLRRALEARDGAALEQALAIDQETDRLFADLQELVMELRMVSVGPTLRRQRRTVRDQAAALGKRVRLEIEGDDVEVDTKIIEHLQDPLTHMVRNALDHGIETPAAREALGKDPCGTITLRARHEAASVVFEVLDDGAGLRRDEILDRARGRGLVTAQETVDDASLHRVLFEPGFSTAEHVTALSGRGVGLDVVRRNVEHLGGSLTVQSLDGAGTTIAARVPLTLAIISGFAVAVGDTTYVIPLHAVVEVLVQDRIEGPRAGGRGTLDLRGAPLPCLHLAGALGQRHHPHPQRSALVVVQHQGERTGLVVDALLGEHQTVIKPLGPLLRRRSAIAASAIVADGRVALVLDVPGLLREAEAHARDRHPDADRVRSPRPAPAAQAAHSGEER